jgi:hypothetical protein
MEGNRAVADKFNDFDSDGPSSVRRFVEDTQLLGERSADQWQQNVFGQVDAWLRALGLRD